MVSWKLLPRDDLFYVVTTAWDPGPGRKGLCSFFLFKFQIPSLQRLGSKQSCKGTKLPHPFGVWRHDSASSTTTRGRRSFREPGEAGPPIAPARPPPADLRCLPPGPAPPPGESSLLTRAATGPGRRVTWPEGAANQRSPLRYSNRRRGRRVCRALFPPGPRGLQGRFSPPCGAPDADRPSGPVGGMENRSVPPGPYRATKLVRQLGDETGRLGWWRPPLLWENMRSFPSGWGMGPRAPWVTEEVNEGEFTGIADPCRTCLPPYSKGLYPPPHSFAPVASLHPKRPLLVVVLAGPETSRNIELWCWGHIS